ncbi:MAG: Hsp70 family protein [Bacteroidota bacterium]
MINFGIDLGTTNSAIATFSSGDIQVFTNPLNQKPVLPSVIAFKGERTIVGDKAREYLGKEGVDVFTAFKRKMGSDETYALSQKEGSLSPIDLSSLILKELKGFIHTGQQPEEVVITIPASFDTMQSAATVAAGKEAGFTHVELLQEPIAASLAYLNQLGEQQEEHKPWLVYDLGGGTFDAAIVEISQGEMKVRDHIGDNFLGGTDFDQLIMEKILIPALEEAGHFPDLAKNIRDAKGPYRRLYPLLMYKAEEAKIQLSQSNVAEIELDLTDQEGKLVEVFKLFYRKELVKLLKKPLKRTLSLIHNMLKVQKIEAQDLDQVLLVGGSTYIPYLREELGKQLGIHVNTEANPTLAVVQGAAWYAGSLKSSLPPKKRPKTDSPLPTLEVKVAYAATTQDMEEFFTAKFTGPWKGMQYRLTRTDGGYDSGLKPLQEQIQEELPLVKNAFNEFDLKVFDPLQNQIPLQIDPIQITQGSYGITGQPLPDDICLEIDDVENQRTILDTVFEKNAVLPLKKTLIKQVSRNIIKESEEGLLIRVLEGPGYALPSANQSIGHIFISGKDLKRDLIKGSDIEITLEMSPSRELSVNVYLMMSDQEFENVFTPKKRAVHIPSLMQELSILHEHIREEIYEAEANMQYEAAQKLVDLEFEVIAVKDQLKGLNTDDITDEKFQIEAQKRQIAQQVDKLVKDKFIIKIKNRYFRTKRGMEFVMMSYQPAQSDVEAYEEILAQEKEYLASNSPLIIQGAIDRINHLHSQIMWRSPQYLKEIFYDLAEERYGKYKHPQQAEALIQSGKQAIAQEQYNHLRSCINRLWELLPPQVKTQINFNKGTGIE